MSLHFAPPTEMAIKRFESREFPSPMQAEQVANIKQLAAMLWNDIDALMPSRQSDEKEAGRLVALAKTDLESAVMWATKAASRLTLIKQKEE